MRPPTSRILSKRARRSSLIARIPVVTPMIVTEFAYLWSADMAAPSLPCKELNGGQHRWRAARCGDLHPARGFRLAGHWRRYLIDFHARRHSRAATLRVSASYLDLMAFLPEPGTERCSNCCGSKPMRKSLRPRRYVLCLMQTAAADMVVLYASEASSAVADGSIG